VVRALATWAFFAGLATIGLFAARRFAPGRHELELDVYVLVLGVLGVLTLLPVLGRLAPPEGESRLESALEREPAELPRIAELERLERELSLGAARAFDLHYRVRPIIREVAAARLERRGLRLDSEDPVVRERLGDRLFELIGPDRSPPTDRQTAGPGVEELRQTIERLERL
jgi:hypothetical protein